MKRPGMMATGVIGKDRSLDCLWNELHVAISNVPIPNWNSEAIRSAGWTKYLLNVARLKYNEFTGTNDTY